MKCGLLTKELEFFLITGLLGKHPTTWAMP
jgi:hypothetical protein